jgi:hypothetical protein
MGISVTLVAATDEEIRRFSSDAKALHHRFHAGAGPSCHLNDFWDGLDFVLTAESGDALPLAVIKRGDLRYPDADDPTTRSSPRRPSVLRMRWQLSPNRNCAAATTRRRCWAAPAAAWFIPAVSGLPAPPTGSSAS